MAGDYFDYGGKSYVVVVDRYSGWPVVSRCRDRSAGELIRLLREYCCTYGVPEEIATDGVMVFISAKVKLFMKTW